MLIDVKAKDEEGTIVFEGSLNRREVGFLLQYAIGDLLAAGVQFNSQEPDVDEPLRFKFPAQGSFDD